MSNAVLEAPSTTAVAAPRQFRVVEDNSPFANLLDTARYEHLWRLAQTFAASDMVPAQFQGKPANCLIALQMALRLGVDPFMFMQGCYIVHGRPGIEAKLAIALANKSGRFTGPIRFKLFGEGPTRGCTAYATIAGSDDDGKVDQTVTMAMAQAEGWTKNKGTQVSKWVTLPDLMLQYRSAVFLLRLYAPDVLMGMQSKDELDELDPIRQETVTVRSREVGTLDALTEKMRTERPVIENKPENGQQEAAERSTEQQELQPGTEAAAGKEAHSTEERTVQPDSPRDALDPLAALRSKLTSEFAARKGKAGKQSLYDSYCGPDGTLSDDEAVVCKEVYDASLVPTDGKLFANGPKSATEAGY